jgi:hypothetical protein
MTSSLESTVRELVARSGDLHSVVQGLKELPGVAEHRFRTGRLEDLERERDLLSSVRDLGLTIAPEVVALVPVGDKNGVLITRYPVCPGEELIPAARTTGPFKAEAAERLRRDAGKLVENGFAHLGTRGLNHWLVSSRTGAIVLERWSSLQPNAAPGERRSMLKHIEDELQGRGVAG